MSKKLPLDQEINQFLQEWDSKHLISFLQDIIPLFELYDVQDEGDWVADEVGGDIETVRNVRMIRTVYLISRIAEFHAGKLCLINVRFKNLWQRMEKAVNEKRTVS